MKTNDTLNCSLFAFILLFSFISCDSHFNQVQDVNKNENIEYLLEHGISEYSIKMIDKEMAKHLNDIALVNGLTNEQASILINTYIEKSKRINFDSNMTNEISIKHKSFFVNAKDNLNVPLKVNVVVENECDWDTITVAGQNNGAGWVVRSNPGYNHATSFVTLPSSLSVTDNDVPYFILSGSAPNPNYLYTDAGIFYSKSKERWCLFYNLYLCGRTKWDDVVLPANLTGVYLSYTITNTTNLEGRSIEEVRIIAINSSTWQTMATLTATTDANFVWANYGNFRITRATTLAQRIENLNNGAYINHAKWSNSYLYSPNGYWSWDCTRTAIVGKHYKPEHWDKITVHSFTPSTDDDISIHY